MPKFLTQEEVYRILQRELPENVYPDGAPTGFYSTADMAAVADVVATGYGNLERIYENMWPQTADERLADWEIKVFGAKIAGSLPLAERRARVLEKIRRRRSISLWDVLTAVVQLVPQSTFVQIVEWGCSAGGWILDVSELDYSTILNGANLLSATGPLICEDDPANYGLTPEQWAQNQEDAYTYEVRIFGYTPSAEQLQAIDSLLTEIEPARSTHVIFTGLDLSDYLLDTPVTDVGQFSGVDCICVDPSSETGFSGRI